MSEQYYIFCQECPRHWYTEEQCQGREVCPKNERHALGLILALPELPGAEGRLLELMVAKGDLFSSDKWLVCIPQVQPTLLGRSDTVENAIRGLITGYFLTSEYTAHSYPVRVSMDWIDALIHAVPEELRSSDES